MQVRVWNFTRDFYHSFEPTETIILSSRTLEHILKPTHVTIVSWKKGKVVVVRSCSSCCILREQRTVDKMLTKNDIQAS